MDEHANDVPAEHVSYMLRYYASISNIEKIKQFYSMQKLIERTSSKWFIGDIHFCDIFRATFRDNKYVYINKSSNKTNAMSSETIVDNSLTSRLYT